MEKIHSGKSKNRRKSNVDFHKLHDCDVCDDQSFSDLDLDQLSAEIDHLAHDLSAVDDKSISPEVPDTVDTFVRTIELKIKKYNSIKPTIKFGRMTEEDEFFTEAVQRLSKLKTVLGEFPNTPSFNSINKVSQQAMVLMEDEFRALLQDTKAVSLKPFNESTTESINEEDFPGYQTESITIMNKIASVMIPSGYQYECCQAYSTIRKDGLHEQVKRFEFEKVNTEDVHKSKWISLEPDITRWVRLTNHCSHVLFPAERKLGETVFSDHLPVFTSLFIHLLHGITTSLLEFATAVATAKPKPKRFFKFLDMYEAIRDLSAAIDDSDYGDVKLEESGNLKSEISSACDGIGEAVVNIFNELKNSIRNDCNKTPVQGGAIHPLTRYVMNYIKCAFDDYQNTLEHIFGQHVKLDEEPGSDVEKYPALSKQLLSAIDLLDGNLESKSALYKDPSLRYIFLMNNNRYILQIVKGTKEMMGDNWHRRKSSDVRNYHKSYQRETWNRLLQCITQEGVQVNGKPNRRILKERFKNFNGMFDEIYKTQSAWVVSDEQLLSEIRVSITAVVSPAYRSFVGRYKPQFEGGKSIDKYIKYQPEDIESMIETLFEGTEKGESQINTIQAVSTMKQTTGAFKNLLKTYKNVGLM